MSVQELVAETLRQLPPHEQSEVLDFARFLASKRSGRLADRSIKGLCADLGVSISAEEIDEARAEMWGNFPREDLP